MLTSLANEFAHEAPVSIEILIVRLLGAALFCGLIGLERESTNNAAGLRTNMIIGLASCVFTLVGLQIIHEFGNRPDTVQIDPPDRGRHCRHRLLGSRRGLPDARRREGTDDRRQHVAVGRHRPLRWPRHVARRSDGNRHRSSDPMALAQGSGCIRPEGREIGAWKVTWSALSVQPAFDEPPWHRCETPAPQQSRNEEAYPRQKSPAGDKRREPREHLFRQRYLQHFPV